jgi:hypothetical protein
LELLFTGKWKWATLSDIPAQKISEGNSAGRRIIVIFHKKLEQVEMVNQTVTRIPVRFMYVE